MTSNLLVFGSFLVAETTRDLGLLLKAQTLVEFFGSFGQTLCLYSIAIG